MPYPGSNELTHQAKHDPKLSRRGFLCVAAGALAAPSIARAELAGRKISFLIGNEGSGGYEAYARLFAKHLALALPGASVVVEVVPEADGRLAAKRIAEAGPDELTVGLFETAMLYAEIESEAAVPVSLAAFNWIGKMAVDERILIASRQSGIETIKQLKERSEPAIFPASTIVSRSAAESFMLNAMLGLPIKPVPGYDGGQRALAMLSGEAQVILGSFPSQKKMLERGEAVVLLRLNDVPNPSVPADAPLLRDIAPEGSATLVELIDLSNTLGRWIAAPPAIGEDDLAALRRAFDIVVASPDFLAEAKAQDLAIDPLGGAEVQRRVKSLLARKDELRAALAAALSCGRNRAAGETSC